MISGGIEVSQEALLTLPAALLCCDSKGFMRAFKVFLKPYEAPQKSVKRKI